MEITAAYACALLHGPGMQLLSHYNILAIQYCATKDKIIIDSSGDDDGRFGDVVRSSTGGRRMSFNNLNWR